MPYKKILISLPEEAIKQLDMYRLIKGTSRTKNIRKLVEDRLEANKTDFNDEVTQNLSSYYTTHGNN